MIKKALWLFSVLLFLSSCNPSDEEPTPTPDKDSVTILAYLIANNNLNDALLYNIAIMYDGLKSMKEPATLLVYWDGVSSMGDNNSTHLILKYETDGKGKRVAYLGVYRSRKGIAEWYGAIKITSSIRYVLWCSCFYMGCQNYFILHFFKLGFSGIS